LPPDAEARFRASRVAGLADVNAGTFWSIAVLLLAFSAWDAFVDPAHWREALEVRLAGVGVILATGAFQRLPGRIEWMPLLAKVRFVVAVATVAGALARLDDGFRIGVAGLVAVFLTGPYIAIDLRDLRRMNAVALAAVAAIAFAVSLDPFSSINTAVFLVLAAAVSALLGRVLEASNRRAFALELELSREARTDPLTGLANRREAEHRADLELRRAERAGTPLSVIVCDIDHFKSINDRFGHDVGDAAICAVADTLRAAVRETDVLGRWGGEEFIAVLPDTDADTAAAVAERMRAAVAGAAFAGVPNGATISLGAASRAGDEASPRAWVALVKEADQCLYRAKSEGRNRVVTSSPVWSRAGRIERRREAVSPFG
jgi:diguanylate cyclase (GGDEF)-like protein